MKKQLFTLLGVLVVFSMLLAGDLFAAFSTTGDLETHILLEGAIVIAGGGVSPPTTTCPDVEADKTPFSLRLTLQPSAVARSLVQRKSQMLGVIAADAKACPECGAALVNADASFCEVCGVML